MLVDVRRYEPGDVARIVAAGARCDGPPAQIEADLLKTRRVWTLLIDGEPLAAAALIHNWRGTATLAAIVGPVPLRAWPAVKHIARDTLEGLQERNGEYRRVEVSLRDGDRGALRFAHALGFKLEGLMEAYGTDGADYFLAARVRREAEALV